MGPLRGCKYTVFLYSVPPITLFLRKICALENPALPFNPAELIPDWAAELPVAITVCDLDARILYMNLKSVATFSNSGGSGLIGKNLRDCHSPQSNDIIKELLSTGRSNIYTIEKKGVKKMICQIPWYKKGEIAGLVELSIVLPELMPHFIRP